MMPERDHVPKAPLGKNVFAEFHNPHLILTREEPEGTKLISRIDLDNEQFWYLLKFVATIIITPTTPHEPR